MRCRACGHAWRRKPNVSCRRCGSGDVDEVAVDGWAYDDLEEARENPQTTAWSYVDKTLYRCQKCRFEWQVAGESRPYVSPQGGNEPTPAVVSGSRLGEALLGFTGPASLGEENAIRAVPNSTGVHVVWDRSGRLLYPGQSTRTRSRVREHLSGDREASILHEKIGRRLDRQLGRTASRDEIRDWLVGCTFAYLMTSDASSLKARIMGRGIGPAGTAEPASRCQRGGGAAPTEWRHRATTRSTVTATGSCSHTRTTAQPASRNNRSVSTSLALFISTFHLHHSGFVRGGGKCSGQPCQKQPSTKMATLALVKAMSTVRRLFPGTFICTRNLRPAANRARRSAISGFVPDRGKRANRAEMGCAGADRLGSSANTAPMLPCCLDSAGARG